VDWIYMFMAVPAGFLLGFLFFGGLWWTVQNIAGSSRPALLLVTSFLVRTAALLAGFYFLLLAGWMYLLAALAGFLLARIFLTYKYRPAAAEKEQQKKTLPEHE